MEKKYFKALLNALWFFGMLATAVGLAQGTAIGLALALLGIMGLTLFTCMFYDLKKKQQLCCELNCKWYVCNGECDIGGSLISGPQIPPDVCPRFVRDDGGE